MANDIDGMLRRPWTPEEDALLATDIAPVIALKIGRTVHAVRGRRHKLGIAAQQASKPCAGCGEAVEALSARGRTRAYCDECSKRRKLESARRRYPIYYARYPERYSANSRRSKLKRQYGLTEDDYDLMLASQAGGCAICGETDPGGRGRFHVDHDHGDGAVRGLLCSDCNMTLGKCKDDPAILRAAAAYLESARLAEEVRQVG